MKRFLGFALICALFATQVFASKLFSAGKSTTVNIPDAVIVGSTQLAAGDYKVTYQGTAPAVKVTLAKPGSSPVVLDAKLVEGKNNGPAVTLATVNGIRTILQIDIKGGSLFFGASQSTGQ